MNPFLALLVGIVVFWFIFTYLLPMLPAMLVTLFTVVLVAAAIYFLVKLIPRG